MQQQYETEKISKVKLEQDMKKLREFYDGRLANVEGQIEKLPTTAESESLLNELFHVSFLLFSNF